ncbi:MBL fold metallo-hydrolase [Metabacillus arenae]|uniref:MBL fold metallo-hydrolase n=1 Tax=Metabacillus arenae TaxID=2771434 RepID=A0A926NQS3_9BACI|nr:MBL fold metallo-hydrolase [Metabacillus arenae]MBD1382302.1 MBL fold metallo-hydrolase [Metabacillus arenae]
MDKEVEDSYIPVTSVTSKIGRDVGKGLYCLPIQIVNIVFVTTKTGFVLVDAGMPQSADVIVEAAKKHYGKHVKPEAILLTHGHFDHVGALEELLEIWDVPVYAHDMEIPYLNGEADYPPPDPSVDGGLVTEMSVFFPHKGINISSHLQPLPADGSIPGMPEWKWVYTPGHTPGHVSFFRETDRALIAGDAFVTVKQESLYKVITQKQEISGPPKYFTVDWDLAFQSVKVLQQLNPQTAITGHGIPMCGNELQQELLRLVRDFDEIALPEKNTK